MWFRRRTGYSITRHCLRFTPTLVANWCWEISTFWCTLRYITGFIRFCRESVVHLHILDASRWGRDLHRLVSDVYLLDDRHELAARTIEVEHRWCNWIPCLIDKAPVPVAMPMDLILDELLEDDGTLCLYIRQLYEVVLWLLADIWTACAEP